MAIYGNLPIRTEHDSYDRIGIRSLVLSKLWQASRPYMTDEELAGERPAEPKVGPLMMVTYAETVAEKGGLRTRWKFEGVDGDRSAIKFKDRSNSIDYGFDGSFSQIAVEQIPGLQAKIDEFGGIINPSNQTVRWPATYTAGSQSSSGFSQGQGQEQPNPMFGITDFLRMEGVYTFRYATLDISGLLEGVGKIAGSLPGSPPPTVDGRNWLKAAPIYRRRGFIFDVSEPYWLSGPGGWPTPIYGWSGGTSANMNPGGIPSGVSPEFFQSAA